jgi:hypothetical protein
MNEWTISVLKTLIKKDVKSLLGSLATSIVCKSFAETQNCRKDMRKKIN